MLPTHTVFSTALAMAASLLAVSAAAQTRPVYVKNVDERGRVPYQVSIGITNTGCTAPNCFNSSMIDTPAGTVLLFDGPAVPAGKRLVVEWVAGDLPANDAYNTVTVQVAPTATNSRHLWHYVGPFFRKHPDSLIQGFSSPAAFTVEPGQSPHWHVRLASPGLNVTQISYVGYLIDASN